MKIALLLCDESTSERLVKLGGYQNMFFDVINPTDKLTVFPIYLNSANGASLEETVNSFPNINEYDGFIVSGSKAGVYEDHIWLPPLFDYIRNIVAINKKLLGICFGHQAIAYALGGDVSKSAKGWGIGHYPNKWLITPEINSPWQKGDELYLLTFHQDQVDLLPKGFEVLAGSKFAPFFVTQYKQQILTTQGHPEMPAAYIEGLSYLLEEQLGKDIAMKGRASLKTDDDTSQFRQCMREFWIL